MDKNTTTNTIKIRSISMKNYISINNILDPVEGIIIQLLIQYGSLTPDQINNKLAKIKNWKKPHLAAQYTDDPDGEKYVGYFRTDRHGRTVLPSAWMIFCTHQARTDYNTTEAVL